MISKLFLPAIAVFVIAFILPQSAGAQAYWEKQARLCSEYSAEKALPHCEQAVREMGEAVPAKEKAGVYLQMGIVLGELERYEESMRYLKMADELDPKNAKIQYNMGVTYSALGEEDRALHAYRRATEIDVNMLDAWGNRGVEAYNTKRYYEAANSFDACLVIDPGYFDTRPEQRRMYDESVGKKPKSVKARREVDIAFSPNIGYLYAVGDDFKAEPLIYLLLDTELAVQIYGGWFGTANFLYGHTKWKSSSQGSGIDIYAPTFGVKYQRVIDEHMPHEGRMFLDKSRYWFGVALGPYITHASAAAIPVGGPFSLGRNSVDIGVNSSAGFDYFFHSYFGAGLQVKVHWANFDENYFIFSGGPRIVGRF